MTSRRDLAILSCHFNPFGFHSREKNLFEFVHRIARQQAPLYVAELVFADQPLITPSPPANVLRFHGHDVM